MVDLMVEYSFKLVNIQPGKYSLWNDLMVEYSPLI